MKMTPGLPPRKAMNGSMYAVLIGALPADPGSIRVG
jgi:hypothetical protein